MNKNEIEAKMTHIRGLTDATERARELILTNPASETNGQLSLLLQQRQALQATLRPRVVA